jgi:hypothetical protein
MDGGDGTEQRWLWCSGGASRGEARRHELWGHGGGAATGSVAAGSWQRHGRTAVAQRRGGGMKENNGA